MPYMLIRSKSTNGLKRNFFMGVSVTSEPLCITGLSPESIFSKSDLFWWGDDLMAMIYWSFSLNVAKHLLNSVNSANLENLRNH